MTASTRRDGGVDAMTLSEAAALVGGRVVGDGDVRFVGMAPVDEAGPEQMAFLALERYARHAESCEGCAFLVSEEMVDRVPDGRPCVVVSDAYAALRTLLECLYRDDRPEPGVHPTAVLGWVVELGEDVHIGPYVVLADDVTVGSGAVIDAHCVVGRGSSIGPGARLHPHVVVYHDCVIGANAELHAGARIGADGFGYTFVDGEHRKIPQVGRAVLGDEVEVGANTTIDRGSLGDTVVGRGVKIDNLVQIAHNVRVGARSLIASLVGIAGSTRLGRGVWVGGQAGLINQLEIGDGARIAVATKVFRDVPPGETVSGHPARPHREGLRKQAELARLPKRVARIEAEVRRLSGTE
jgi:UDP-3-O-[3-hydroxymyristoyl] glucosamine N-acyltransferase